MHSAAPLLIAAFEGWNDAANAASDALRFLIRALDATEMRELDAETYFDFQAARPQVQIVNGVVRDVRWPSTRLYRARRADRAVVLALGIEPNLQWPAFCAEILAAGRDHGVEVVVTLGALLSDAPHTRPVVVTGTASDPRTAVRLGLARSRYEGPTGIVGVLADAARSADLASVSLWAPVPHYVASPPNPKATLALLEHLDALVEVGLDLATLGIAARAWQEQIDAVARGDDELAGYVRSLEERHDAGPGAAEIAGFDDLGDGEISFEDDWPEEEEEADEEEEQDEDDDDEDEEDEDDEELPSGESLAADFERYLREQREGREPGDE